MTRCQLTLDMARDNLAGVLLAWVEGLTTYHQLDAAAATYQKVRQG